MAKKTILAVIIIFILSAFFINITINDSVNLFIDGENVSVKTTTLNPNVDTSRLNSAICKYTVNAMNDSSSNITTLKDGIRDICIEYGFKNPKINVDSSIGKDQIPVIVYVSGTSMLPTLQDGQSVLINKSNDIHVGDIVVANSDEYGSIIKRVGDINGNEVYLISDNKNVSYTYKNGIPYETKGITTWVDISNIIGVVIAY